MLFVLLQRVDNPSTASYQLIFSQRNKTNDASSNKKKDDQVSNFTINAKTKTGITISE